MAEPLRATFFTLRRRDRAVLAPATLITAVALAIIIAAFAALNWGFFSQIHGFFQRGAEALTEAEGVAFAIGILTLVSSAFLMLIPTYFVLATYEAACLRWMIRGEAPGLFGLRFDYDMWRVYGVYWCWVILQFVISTVVSILAMPIMFMTMGQIVHDPSPEAMWRWQLSTQIPITLLQYIPIIYFGVRFAPAAATSIARRRFAFLDAWKVTQGRFWELFGSFALLWLILVFVMVSASLPATLRLWPEFMAMWASPSEEAFAGYLAAFFAPQQLMLFAAGYVVMVITGIAYALLAFGVNARAALAALEEGKIVPATD